MRPLTLHLLRHGATPGNEAGRYVGDTNEQLSRNGIMELKQLAASRRIPRVEAVFCSPRTRCRETASILYPGVEPVVLEGLRERSFGEFEELSHRDIIQLPGCADWGKTEESMEFPGGEALPEFDRRCMLACEQIKGICGERSISSAAAVTHGGVIMSVLHGLFPRDSRFRWRCGNGGGWRLCWDVAGDFTVEGLPL